MIDDELSKERRDIGKARGFSWMIKKETNKQTGCVHASALRTG